MNYRELNIFYGKNKYKITIKSKDDNIEIYLNDKIEPLPNITVDIFLHE